MNVEELKQLRKYQVYDYISSVLGEARFDMSGYDYGETGTNVIFNGEILARFAHLGIYDYTRYLYLDFYKGNGTIYYGYFYEVTNEEKTLGGMRTVDIIYEIFSLTIFSKKSKRRR